MIFKNILLEMHLCQEVLTKGVNRYISFDFVVSPTRQVRSIFLGLPPKNENFERSFWSMTAILVHIIIASFTFVWTGQYQSTKYKRALSYDHT